MRLRGLSYREISEKTGIAKSTLSLWLKNLSLSSKHRKRLYTKQINVLSLGPQSQKERRARAIEKIIETARQEISTPLSTQTLQLMGAALYWAEGSKGRQCQITNSDPHLILFMVSWIRVVFQIPPTALKARLNLYPQQNKTAIKKFWSDLTGIPLNNFGKSYIKPLSSGYKKNNLYYGTIRIEIPKSADLVHTVFGWIKKSLDEIAPQVRVTQKKWKVLEKTKRPINL